ncbi:unnamed protein product [Rotaria sordida]|uniref:Uncharacterized protein n=2 Tax=Rotaria sordida TaxID=392033 RepID=A0A819UXZ0_9BILA|nr:unnamed protein product [Rotaria sordida]CAF4088387.1 unnamed protein product [Rotaria sordida]
MATINSSAVLPERMRPILENCLLIWLDADFDELKNDYKQSMQQLRNVIATIITFTDADQCVDYLSDVKDEKVLMIISGLLGQHVIPEIQACPQLNSVYVFCDNQSIHEQWARKIPKIKGICTQIEPICKALEIDHKHCDRSMISMSFRGIDPLFMYTQLLKEAFLEIEDDDATSIKELVDYCRLHNAASPTILEKLEREYRHHPPIWWYTGPFFIYSMLNHALRLMNVDVIMRMGFFIRHLHKHIEKLHGEQQSNEPTNRPFTVFRGQGLSMEDFDKMKQTKGGLMSFNNFISTSRQRDISLGFARLSLYNTNSVAILFVMNIDPMVCVQSKIPYVDVKGVGYYDNKEEEVLFTTHTIFRVNQMKRIEENDTDRLWQVNLTLTDDDDNELNTLTKHLRADHKWTTGWNRLGRILIELGDPAKAEHLYTILLDKASSDYDRVEYYHQLGTVYTNMGEHSKALSSYERSLEINKIALPPNHPNLASSYNNIGEVYRMRGEYSKTLSSFERSLEIRKIALPPNHSDLAMSYNNIASVYDNMGEYPKALSSYERSLEIRKIALPPNHPHLAHSYNNIGVVYYNMGDYSKALSSFERSLQIRKIALPPNHPDLAVSYRDIGGVYNRMGEYSKALSSFERSLEIQKIALSPNHLQLAASYNNIGLVYENMGEYLKALSYYEKDLEISLKALPSNHPNFAQSYNNIGNVYSHMGEYSKALSSYEQSLEIKKIALPPNHPDLGNSYNNIGGVYDSMGEYSKALTYYEKDLEISLKALPPNHPDLATSHNNIGVVYYNMGEYSKALSSYERSLEIQKITLPPNHSDLASSYNNIGAVYRNMGEYSKALSSHERSLEIQKIALPPNHPSLASSYNNIGAVYDKMGEYSKALSSYERSLEIKKIALPLNHPDLASSFNNIGLVYHHMGEYSKALQYYEKAQEIWKKSLPSNHPHIALAKRNIDNVKKKM